MRTVYKPKPYQNNITSFILNHGRCGIWAGMGMGKTSSTLTALSILERTGELDAPVLVLAPLRVAKSVWPAEVEKWDHLSNLSITPLLGSAAVRERLLKADTAIHAINYENIAWLVDTIGVAKWPYKTIIADESPKLKSFRLVKGGKRAAALSKVVHSKVKYFHNLTGTPASNGLQDLWGQTWMLDAGKRLCKSYTAFKEKWFKADYFGFSLTPHEWAEQQIYDALKDIHLTVKPEDYFDIKEPIFIDVVVDLPGSVMDSYKSMEKEMYAELDPFTITAASAVVKTQKLLQLSSGCVYLDEDDRTADRRWREVHDEKIEALRRIISEANGAQVLVAYYYKFDMERLTRAFPEAKVLDNKSSTINDWNAGKIPVLLAHPKSAGHGLSLQDGGNILVFFGIDWNLEEYLQIIERIGPMRQLQSGHNRPVYVYRILSNTGIDALVSERLTTKKSIQEVLMDAMKRRS